MVISQDRCQMRSAPRRSRESCTRTPYLTSECERCDHPITSSRRKIRWCLLPLSQATDRPAIAVLEISAMVTDRVWARFVPRSALIVFPFSTTTPPLSTAVDRRDESKKLLSVHARPIKERGRSDTRRSIPF